MHIALIGGTGIDELPELISGKRLEVSTRFGTCDYVEVQLGNRPVVFVPRHGFGHTIPPSLINYRAQIAGLKKLGVNRIISVCAVGALTSELEAGSFAILSDFIDFTKHRRVTFFDEPNSPIAHTDFSQPYCPELRRILVDSCKKRGVTYSSDAVYVGVDGPRYETPAETRLFASWGGHVVGMTNVPEVVLAREAGICFAALAIVCNPACGLSDKCLAHEDVRKVVRHSAETTTAILKDAISQISDTVACDCGKHTALVV